MPFNKESGVNVEKKIESLKRSQSRIQVMLVLIIFSIVVLSPVLYFWTNSQQDTSHTIVFALKGSEQSWHTGELVVWFSGGSLDCLPPYYTTPMYDDEDTQIGWRSLIDINHNFTEPETCRFEYICSELNVTVGPIQFVSNQPQILYQGSFGRIIELWVSR